MIGIFDSWLWGLISLWYLQAELPQQSFLYLWDTKYLPYGDKSPKFLQERTFECLEWMFDKWCEIVILACNSASAYAIRARQETYPDRKVLSVTVPGVEAIVEWWYEQPLLLATQATVDGDIYPRVLARSYPSLSTHITQVPGHGLVQLIESWATDSEIVTLLTHILQDQRHHDCIILWCTHYPLIAWLISQIMWADTSIINPARESAHKLSTYIKKHPELGVWITDVGIPSIQYYITGDETHYGDISTIQHISI